MARGRGLALDPWRSERGASVAGHPCRCSASPEEIHHAAEAIAACRAADAYPFELPWAGRWRIDVIVLNLRTRTARWHD